MTLVGSENTVTVIFDKYVSLDSILTANVVLLGSDETTFKRGASQTRVVQLTMNVGQVSDVEVQFKKTGNWISSSWYSATWNFTKATVLDGDQQQRCVSICSLDP